jgi:ribosomal protein L30E
MVDTAVLSKVLRDAMKSGKYTLGAKESMSSMKGCKAIICSRSIPTQLGSRLKEEASKHKVPVIETDASSAELARLVGRPFRVSVVGLRSIGEADLKQLLR